MAKIKKEYILLGLFFILLSAVGFIVLKNSQLLGLDEESYLSSSIRPAYLKEPIPEIKKINTVVNNPKFKEMQYVRSFFEPLEKGVSGRVNPFMPWQSKN
jgi:hypothetical protein